jgi:hypothetical protein
MEENTNSGNKEIIERRPFFLSILCMVVFVYSTFFILILSTGLIYRNWITGVLNDFAQSRQFETSSVILFSVSGVFLYGLSFAGALLMWRIKKIGYYLYVFSSAMIFLIPLFFGFENITNVIIFSVLIILFSLYYRRLK